MNENIEKTKLINTFLIVGFLILFIFGIDNIFIIKNVVTGIVEIILALALVMNFCMFKITKNLIFSSYQMLFVLFVSLVFMYIDGGIGGKTGIYWFFTFPVIAYFLLGEVVGSILTLALLGSIIIVYIISSTPFSLIETRQLIIAITTVTILIRYYWKTNAFITKKMAQNIIDLEEYSKKIKENEENKNAKKIEIERTNQAMINLIEDAKQLENDLVNEKKNVEAKVLQRTKELDEEKSKLTASIEALSKAFVMLDLKGKVILVNGNLNKIFESDNKEWKLEQIQEHLGSSFDFIKTYEKIIKTKKREEFNEVEFGSRFLQIRFNPVYDGPTGGREIIGILAIIGDVTDEKVMERSKDEFFSIASHELRTPLTAIRGNTSMILEYYKEQIKDPDLKSMIDDMHEASIRLIGIVNDFLDLSRLEQNRMVYKLTQFKLNDIVTNVVTELAVTANEKKIKLINNVDKNILVNADADKLKQVLFNIVGNSIKFTNVGGVTLSSATVSNSVKIIVTDTGIGVPLANQSLLFRKFQQAGKSTITRDGAKGTGLGLYISKLMVEGMGGKIALESSIEGKGSVFTFTLPTVKLK